MTNKYLLNFKKWYDQSRLRERIFALLLGIVIIYGFFSFFIFNVLENKRQTLLTSIKEKNTQVEGWKVQIGALNQLAQSSLYKQWREQNQSIQKLQKQYQFLVENSATKQWQDVIKTLLATQPNIKIDQIKNLPETVYHPVNITLSSRKIYQQQILLSIHSDYFNTLDYIKRLEKMLPNMHWNNLNYQVTNYPIAKIEMEFSILYEKS